MSPHFTWARAYQLLWTILFIFVVSADAYATERRQDAGVAPSRQRTSLNAGWRFKRSTTNPDGLMYDKRGDTPSPARALKSWILPLANGFLRDPPQRYKQPRGKPPGNDVPFVQTSYDDTAWEAVDLPHDWAIKGPFYTGDNAILGGGMGRLPVQGVAGTAAD